MGRNRLNDLMIYDLMKQETISFNLDSSVSNTDISIFWRIQNKCHRNQQHKFPSLFFFVLISDFSDVLRPNHKSVDYQVVLRPEKITGIHHVENQTGEYLVHALHLSLTGKSKSSLEV